MRSGQPDVDPPLIAVLAASLLGRSRQSRIPRIHPGRGLRHTSRKGLRSNAIRAVARTPSALSTSRERHAALQEEDTEALIALVAPAVQSVLTTPSKPAVADEAPVADDDSDDVAAR
jgi:hypothetical protein